MWWQRFCFLVLEKTLSVSQQLETVWVRDVSRGVGCSLAALSNLLSFLDWRRFYPGFLICPVLRLRNSTCPSGEEMDEAEDVIGVDDNFGQIFTVVAQSISNVWTSGEFLPGNFNRPWLGGSFEPPLNLELDNIDLVTLGRIPNTLDSDLAGAWQRKQKFSALFYFASTAIFIDIERVGNTAIMLQLGWYHIRWHGDIPLVHVSDTITTQVKVQSISV